MPRYIDADALLTDEMLHTIPFGSGKASGRVIIFVNEIEKLLIDDVVPKSEVDWNSIPVDVSEALKQRAVEKAKSDVAREIFAEIESEILAEIDLCNGVLIEFEEADEPYHRIKGEVSALCKIQDFIAELKKKYTEGEG